MILIEFFIVGFKLLQNLTLQILNLKLLQI